MLAFDHLPHAGYTLPALVANDQLIMQRCSCCLACPSAHERRQSEVAASVITPLLVKFFEQHLARKVLGLW